MSFNEKLQTLRKNKGLSQETLSEIIGVSRQAVAKWEVGQSFPDIDKLILLSNFFRVSIDKLVKTSNDSCSNECENNIEYEVSEKSIDFLIKAKKSGYAGKGIEAISSRPSSHDFQYSEGDLKYIDTYIGGEKFAGEEALWIENTPFWSMNYIGRITGEGFSGDFLKEVLLLVPKDKPYRGPLSYQKGDYTYHCFINGKFDWFQGLEEIFYNGAKVYECIFHGGLIK